MPPEKSKSKPKAAVKAKVKSKAPALKSTSVTPKPAKKADHAFQSARRSSILLKHLSDATRLQVIMLLADGEKHVGLICEHLKQSQPAVSHHLALLRHGGIIMPRRQGKNNIYSLTDTGRILSTVVKMLSI